MLTVDQAREYILEQIQPLGVERVMLTEALGRVLAEPVLSPVDLPRFAYSLMDGYALGWEDLAGFDSARGARLFVPFENPAGRVPERALARGEAVRVMTGSLLPDGADTVVMKEDTHEQERWVTIHRLPDGGRGAFVCRSGEYAHAGTPLLPAGQVVDPSVVGALASIGRCTVLVHRHPRVAVVATGDELVEIDQVPGPGQIPNSAAYLVAALVRHSGGIPVTLPTAPDRLEECMDRLREAVAVGDLAISIGGVSVGDYDVVRQALDGIGRTMGFWRVAMKPGKPLAFGMVGGTPVFGLPGNPVSAFVNFYQFVWPAIRRARGLSGAGTLPEVRARLAVAVQSERERRELMRGRLVSKAGETWFQPHPHQGSGNLLSLLQADGLGIIPEGVDRLDQGETITVQRIPCGV